MKIRKGKLTTCSRGHRFYKNFREEKKQNLPLLFLLVYGIFSLVYYIGESTWQNLYLVSVPLILIALYFCKNYFETRLAKASFLALLAFTAMFLAVKIPVEFAGRDYGQPRNLLMTDFVEQDLTKDAEDIKNNYPQLSRIPLIHLNDTSLLILTEKVNLLDFYYIFTLYYREDVEREVATLRKQKPEFVFIGQRTNDQIEYFTSLLEQDYQVAGSLRTLDIYTRK